MALRIMLVIDFHFKKIDESVYNQVRNFLIDTILESSQVYLIPSLNFKLNSVKGLEVKIKNQGRLSSPDMAAV